MTVRRGGRWGQAGLGDLLLGGGGAHGILEEASRTPGLGGWPAGELDSPGPQPSKRGRSEAWLPQAEGGRRRRSLGELGGTADPPPFEGWEPIPFPGPFGALGLRSP